MINYICEKNRIKLKFREKKIELLLKEINCLNKYYNEV